MGWRRLEKYKLVIAVAADNVSVLVREYSGDLAWKSYVDVLRPQWENVARKKYFIEQFGDEELAIVLAAALGDQSVTWFNTKCKALSDRIPGDVLKSEELGMRALRSFLMRFP